MQVSLLVRIMCNQKYIYLLWNQPLMKIEFISYVQGFINLIGKQKI